MQTRRTLVILALAAGLSAVGCGSPVLRQLDLEQLPKGEGAAVGRIKVYTKGADITADCAAFFHAADGSSEHLGHVDLPHDGWVFVVLPARSVRLLNVACLRRSVPAYRISFAPGVRFTVGGGAQLAYFGHLQLEEQGEGVTLMEALAPTPTSKPVKAGIWFDDWLDIAAREYRIRYGARRPALRPARTYQAAFATE